MPRVRRRAVGNPLSRGAACAGRAFAHSFLRFRWMSFAGGLKKLEQELPSAHQKLVEPYLLDLQTKLRRLSDVGLGYLSLERQAGTLSGGETQRLPVGRGVGLGHHGDILYAGRADGGPASAGYAGYDRCFETAA